MASAENTIIYRGGTLNDKNGDTWSISGDEQVVHNGQADARMKTKGTR